MFPPKTKMCHRTGFQKSCFELCASEACQDRWVHVTGDNAQTGEPIDKWGCVDDQAVMLQLDQTRRVHGVWHAIDKMRNEVVKLQVEQIARQERQHREALSFAPQALAPELPAGISLQALEHAAEPADPGEVN
jgi:hypothetical protein